MSVQVPPQQLGLSFVQQVPLQHGLPLPVKVQELPQLPQFSGSLLTLIQTPLHWVCPAGHGFVVEDGVWQVPAWQMVPEVQTCPQVPQFLLSLLISVQLPLQAVWPEGHDECWHEPSWQLVPK
jgi:hypothetical protein